MGDEDPMSKWVAQGAAEPSLAVRNMANALRQFHVALRQQGFGETQALSLTNQFLASLMANNRPGSKE